MSISDQPTQNIDKKIGYTAMARVFNLGIIFELVNDRLDDGSLTQQDLVGEKHQAVFHV